jgi:hypothetical protein
MQMKLQKHSPTPNDPPQKPEFKPPEGYTIRWQTEWGTGFYVLRDSEGQELGLFEMLPDRNTVEGVLKSHLSTKVVGDTRETMKAIIVLKDSNGKVVGSFDINQPPQNPIEVMVKDLASR